MKRIENFVLPEHTNNLYQEEAISSIALTKDVADKINELVNAYNEFSKSDLEWKQEQEGTIRKGVIYMKDNLLNALNDLMVLLRDSGFIDDRIEYHCDYLKARLDNIIAVINSGEKTKIETELIDIRTAWNSVIRATAGESVRQQIIDVLNRENSSVYVTSDGSVTAESIENGGLSVSIGNILCLRLHPETKELQWEDISSDLVDNNLISINGNKATITINQFRKALVYNTSDGLLHIRGDIGGVEPADIVLIDNGYGSVIGGELYGQYIITRLREIEKYSDVIPTSKQFLYIGDNGKVTFTPSDDGGLKVAIGGKLIGLFGTAEGYEWSDIGSEIANRIEISADGKSAVININQFRRTLVFNVKDKKLYIRNFDNIFDINDYVLVQNAWSNPIGGALVDMYVKNTAESALAKAGTGGSGSNPESMKYPVNEDALMRLANVQMNNSEPTSTFLYFTDPHLCEGDDWKDEFDAYAKNIEETFKRSGASFIVCGGDWIGNSDTKQEACYKLAYANSRMKAITPNFYFVVGNHDTNYQGVSEEGAAAWSGTLNNQTIGNIVNNGGKNYYHFTDNNYLYFVLDTGSDQNHSELTDYDREQVQYFVNVLKERHEKKLSRKFFVFAHIGWLSDGSTLTIHPLIQELLDINYGNGDLTDYDPDAEDSSISSAYGYLFCGMFTGHIHKEKITTDFGYYDDPIIIARDHLRSGGIPTFDVVLTHRDFVYDTTIEIVNFGSGSDQSLTIVEE